jgi:hypothetical protein
MIDSDLYLRYILGEVPPDSLHVSQERHIRCNPSLAQFIVDARFDSITCAGAFDKSALDPAWVLEQEARVTAAWQRLQTLPSSGLSVLEYPLPDVRRRWQKAK